MRTHARALLLFLARLPWTRLTDGHTHAPAVELVEGVFLGADIKLASHSVAAGKTRASDFKFFYSVVQWKRGELEAEMASHKWVAAACSKELLLKAPDAWDRPLWRLVLELMGGKFALISRYLSADL